MFSTSSFASPYSPFFTSGLLSTTTSRSPSPDISLEPRRGSLPTNAPLRTTASVTDESAAFYFTFQPKRDLMEYRSFLSLDLAESQSMRSASLKRKASSKANSRSSKPPKPSIPSISYPYVSPFFSSISLSSHFEYTAAFLRNQGGLLLHKIPCVSVYLETLCALFHLPNQLHP
jgi:hypothetical protein